MRGGIKNVSEQLADSSKRDSSQVIVGASRDFLNRRLRLRSDAEIDVSHQGENADYPSRGIFGLEYEVVSDVKLIAEQELSWGDDRDTQDTRFGVKARPWSGAEIATTLTQQQGENGQRLFATSL